MRNESISLARNPVLDETPFSVFEALNLRLRKNPHERIIPLHQGKTAFTTEVELRPWNDDEFDFPPHHDGPPGGTDSLIAAIKEKLDLQFGQDVDPQRIQITCGITHALSIIYHCILRPGDEVIVLSPQWLFATGLIRAAGGIAVEVPFFPTTASDLLTDVSERIKPFVSSRTRAIYFNLPNNPTGRTLSPQQLSQLGQFASEHALYLVSDNAYEFYDYTDYGFIDPAAYEDGRDNTFSAYSFSKSFGMTGYRIGYLLSPPQMAELARKFALYSIYSVPTCCQFAALSALRSGPEVVANHRKFIKQAIEITTKELRVPFTIPDGGFYTLLDLSSWKRGTDHLINECISEGVSLAPGRAFGPGYEDYARLCYSVVENDELREGIRIINQVFERGA